MCAATGCVQCDMRHTYPPKQPPVLVSWSDLPVWTNLLYQPAFGFWPDVFGPGFFSRGSLSTDSSCGAITNNTGVCTDRWVQP